MKRMVRGIVGVVGTLLAASQAGATITTAYSDDFSGYSNGYSLGDSDHWTIVRGFYAGTVNTANTYAKYVTAYPGQLATQAAAEGQLTLIYDDESVGSAGFKASVDVTNINSIGKKGGLVFNWSTLADSTALSGYVLQIYSGSAIGTSGVNASIRLIKYVNANSGTTGEAPVPTATLLNWTDLTEFNTMTINHPITLSVTSDGNGTFTLSAVQGTNTWTATITDNSALTDGYIGIATQRGVGADETTDDRNWASAQYDNFSVSPVPEPAAMGLLGVGGLMGLSRRRS